MLHDAARRIADGASLVDRLLLTEDGRLRSLPAAHFDAIPWEALRLWTHMRARYGLPTRELVGWLHDRIGGRRALEIGAGAGDLAHLLGIRATDNHQQEWPDVAAFYQLIGQPCIRYPAFVERLSAADAMRKYDPDVVVASWVTEWVDPYGPVPPQGGNVHGVQEEKIIEAGRTYILVGNEAVHGRKRIMALPHETFELPFLRSRAHDRDRNRVWVWGA